MSAYSDANAYSFTNAGFCELGCGCRIADGFSGGVSGGFTGCYSSAASSSGSSGLAESIAVSCAN